MPEPTRLETLTKTVANFEAPLQERQAAAEGLRHLSTGAKFECTKSHIEFDGLGKGSVCDDGKMQDKFGFAKAPSNPNSFILTHPKYFNDDVVAKANKALRQQESGLEKRLGKNLDCKIEDGRYKNRLVCKKAPNRARSTTSARNYSENFFRFCFTEDMLLMQEGGALITFGDLAKLAENGRDLPRLASYNEESKEVIFQQPTKLIDHGYVNSTVLFLNLESEGVGSQLKTTPNHELLIERDGETLWTNAGALEIGDLFVGPESYHLYTGAGSASVTGGFNLFDISFGAEETGQVPTFIVSPDGENWVVAHNKM